jgi:hypothetical protein
MSRTRFVLTLLLGAVAAALPPTSAHAGWYHVQSCHPDGVAPGWVTSDVAHTTAYIDCGSASTSAGLRARNVIDGKYAPGFSAAAVSIGAPAGTHFDWMSFDADLTADLGWSAGVYDFQNRRWAWCGRSCFTSFGWRRFEIPLRSTTAARWSCAPNRGAGRTTRPSAPSDSETSRCGSKIRSLRRSNCAAARCSPGAGCAVPTR